MIGRLKFEDSLANIDYSCWSTMPHISHNNKANIPLFFRGIFLCVCLQWKKFAGVLDTYWNSIFTKKLAGNQQLFLEV